MVDKQAGDEDLLKLQVPCPVQSTTLEQLAKCIHTDGHMELSMELLLPMLQLGEAIKVCRLTLYLGVGMVLYQRVGWPISDSTDVLSLVLLHEPPGGALPHVFS